MARTLYWLQAGGCGGDTFSLLSAETPDVLELIESLSLEVLWHPSFSTISPAQHRRLVERIVAEEQPLDILCVEGAVIRGPGGTGMFDAVDGAPRKDLITRLAHKARYILAVGTCAAFGGVGAGAEVEATGLQFHRGEPGGFLGRGFTSRAGLPVINLPGCPCHHEVKAGTLAALLAGEPPELDPFNAPICWYGLLVHQGCVRNEYHEYRVEESIFGEKGCLFFYLGCRGPLTYGPCNKALWNRRSSKTRVGVPCFGCTRPDFPRPDPLFATRNIAAIPIDLPDGVDRAHYLAYKGLAAAAAPERLRKRKTLV